MLREREEKFAREREGESDLLWRTEKEWRKKPLLVCTHTWRVGAAWDGGLKRKRTWEVSAFVVGGLTTNSILSNYAGCVAPTATTASTSNLFYC